MISDSEVPILFSIIVPTHSRPKQAAELLRSLTQLDYPRHRFEVIVVIDGGDHPPPGVMETFCSQLNLSFIHQAHQGPAAARNRGAVAARGTFLVFTDDDCLPAPDWLRILENAFAQNPECVIGGRIVAAFPESLYATTSRAILDAAYQYFNLEPAGAIFFASCNLAVPKKQFHAINGFNPTFRTAEDREFCSRWLQQGFRMVYVPELLIRHAQRNTFGSFWRRHFSYGRGAYRYHRLRAVHAQKRIQLGPLSFYWKLFRFPFSQGWGGRAIAVEMLLIISQLANAIGFIWELQQQKK